jgi:hypothetical protein
MSSETSFFPGGITGCGLLLLRFSVAVSVLMLAAHLSQASYLPQFLGVVVAAGLCVGLQTRVLAGLSVLAPLLCLVMAVAHLELVVLHALMATALAMTGPGAFSVDARLFGRRTITLPDRDDPKV